jgi:hypothetical protein
MEQPGEQMPTPDTALEPFFIKQGLNLASDDL